MKVNFDHIDSHIDSPDCQIWSTSRRREGTVAAQVGNEAQICCFYDNKVLLCALVGVFYFISSEWLSLRKSM